MSELAIEITPYSDVTVVALIGSAGLEGSSELDRRLIMLSAQRPRKLIFDVGRLTFISSLAMSSLIQFTHGLSHHGGKLAIASAQPAVAEVLQRMRLESVMPMYATLDHATAALQ